MSSTSSTEIPAERFDELFFGDPAAIEQRLLAIRPRALLHPDPALVPQIDSQIALAQAMQRRIDEAFATLDRAEKLPGAALPIARTRLLLERGRVFQQARRPAEAVPWMVAAYQLGLEHRLDFHAINAAHVVAIAASNVEEKIRWNRTALEMAAATPDERARSWLVVLHNNLGQALIAAGRFEDALATFATCRDLAAQRGDALVGRGGRWGMARAMRSLGRSAEALAMQQHLLQEYDELQRERALPDELICMCRGVVYEELAELLPSHAVEHAAQALRDLQVNDWFRDLEPARWERLQHLAACHQPASASSS